MSARIDINAIPEAKGTSYPPPHDELVKGRRWRSLGDAAGLTQFGIHRLVLDPGVWSSQRHWHTHEDEFVMVLEGSVTLVTDAGPETLVTGDCAGFKAGSRDGHHLRNDTDTAAVILVIGGRVDADRGGYSDIDMQFLPYWGSDLGGYATKAGVPIDARASTTIARLRELGEAVDVDDIGAAT